MGCVASADIKEPATKKATKPPLPGRTLLTSVVDSPKGAAIASTVAPPAGHRQPQRSQSAGPVSEDFTPRGAQSPGKSILRSKSASALPKVTRHFSRGAQEPAEPEVVAIRSVKRRITFGNAETREYKVQLTHSRSF
eukprot:CAMPEP_0197647294 /NCGR_PEP_ID=MMETSP1338-20131121/24842_1 /TAXON_ID=43686 ORGANISM="Pelagodinium beii, Strain RCC1491" /NCGR_SAMPLE_ID=MMETSP1338 /ASSEMBLY_ACC=CAM_ASM_000754 /LENGTH=136 /DNA_ID=CAMNT_0043221061 /DNA_START=39 /DNA_END=449 /DNA_ORIENTATION=-